MVKSGSFQVGQGSLGARLGTGIGKGLGEQIPKEVERQRLKTGLEEFAREAPGLDPLQAAAKYLSIPGLSPQAQQILPELSRQQSIINRYRQEQEQQQKSQVPTKNISEASLKSKETGLKTATTPSATKSLLEPYIPMSGPQREAEAKRLFIENPQEFGSLDAARGFVDRQEASNLQQSQAQIGAAQQQNLVQEQGEQKLRNEISTLGANIPGTLTSKLQQEAVDDITSGNLSVDQAKVKYGKMAQVASQDFSNIRSWGGLGLVLNNKKDLINSIKTLHQNAKKGGYQKEAADTMIADNMVTPKFAYATMYPVSDVPDLSKTIKELPDIKTGTEKVVGMPGLAGVGYAGNKDAARKTREIAPKLAKAMGLEGSPLAIAYELEKKGYDPQVWKDYVTNSNLNLSDFQRDELQKTQTSFFGQLNDLFLKTFSGVE